MHQFCNFMTFWASFPAVICLFLKVTLCRIHSILTIFTVNSGVALKTSTRIGAKLVDTLPSVLAWKTGAFVDIWREK